MPPATQIDRCKIDPVARTSGGASSSLRVSCDDVLEFLAKGKVVSAASGLVAGRAAGSPAS